MQTESSTIAMGGALGTQGSLPTMVIQPVGRFAAIDVRELWEYRGLFWFLVWRDIKVRYAQTVLGAGWAVLQPLLTMVLFTVIFGNFARIPSDGVPYAAFAITALVPWTYFSTALTNSSMSLVSSANLITKVYFPRLVIPAAPVLAGLLDFFIGTFIILGVVVYYGLTPSLMALFIVPLVVVVMTLTAAGVGAWLAALNVQYRDIRYVVPFLVQVWMYASPVVYPASIVPERFRLVYALNPMVGVIEGLRVAFLGTGEVGWSTIGFSLGTGLLLFVGGIVYFRRVERTFADVA
ncbi:MAG TPA: ABC transporter permease [Myxococcaceae bacterium]